MLYFDSGLSTTMRPAWSDREGYSAARPCLALAKCKEMICNICTSRELHSVT
jgi:hypothetical protein